MPVAEITMTVETPVLPYHRLTVKSWPVEGVPVVIDTTEIDGTPVTVEFSPGSYTITVPATFNQAKFVEWEDGSTDPVRVLDLIVDTELTAYYEKPPPKVPTKLIAGLAVAATVTAIGVAVATRKRG